MLAQNHRDALELLTRELNGLGYVGSLIQENYEFADVLSEDIAVNRIPLAAFAQYPPSYRNAAFGVAIANGRTGAELVQMYKSLGAPQIFEVKNNKILRWKVSGESTPTLLDEVDTEQLSQVFSHHRSAWTPHRILQAKSNASQAVQLDFFDVGLLPLLEKEARTKLDHQLSGAVALAINTFERHSQFTDDLYPLLFRLLFRLIAAKMLGDRRHPGDWNADDAKSVLQAVEGFYFKDGKVEPALEDPATQQETWEWIKRLCHFQNLSVDSLAYVYENTLVTQETRKAYSTHSTPYAVAEYIVRNLPFEDLDPDKRKVFEPFSGHSIFLIAAMQRMRELLPSSMSSRDRHEYFVKMLSGIEIDEFALEVGRLSLMLADYPNPDGWRLHHGDAFTSPIFAKELNGANVVLCNPPFERFRKQDQTMYENRPPWTKAADVLGSVLAQPPQLLGFVLPRVFVEGRQFKQLRATLGQSYSKFELLELPDRVFERSEAETVLLLSSKRGNTPALLTVGKVLSSDLQDFYATQKISYQALKTVDDPPLEFAGRMWLPQLQKVWDATSKLPTLGSLAEIHRGMQYNRPLVSEAGGLVSSVAFLGGKEGLHTVRGAIEPFIVTHTDYLNTSEEFMSNSAYKYDWNAAKVIVNANAQSRGNWRITASIDRSGLVCYQNFHAIWPKTELSLELLAATLNGPVANAFISSRDPMRHVLIRTMRDIPIPEFNSEQKDVLTALVHQYVDIRNKWIRYQLEEGEATSECRRLISAIDAEVLNAYGLPPEQERALLDWFTDSTRLGPIEFNEYSIESLERRSPESQYIPEVFGVRTDKSTLSKKTLLFNELQADFVAAPLEDGMEHEAERTLSKALSTNPDKDLLHWLSEFCTDLTRPDFASSILRCLANLHHPGTPDWRVNLLQEALCTDNVEIKAAAVQAVEHWADSDLLEILSSHQEDVPWLRQYIEGVIDDLGG